MFVYVCGGVQCVCGSWLVELTYIEGLEGSHFGTDSAVSSLFACL